MINRWNDDEAKSLNNDLDLRVYTSRLLGQDPSLVLHGGGNTSVKTREKNVVGEEEDILHVKGSGWDLATIEREGFAPVRMERLLKLARLEKLSDPDMVNELKTQMTNAKAPGPSVETILHAILPFKFVDHTHADSFVTVTNTPDGEAKVKEIYGDRVVYIPYVMPGFDLARTCAKIFERDATDKTIGMALMNHGLFTFGDTAKVSYDLMINLVGEAEDFIKSKNAWNVSADLTNESNYFDRVGLALLRKNLSAEVSKPMILSSNNQAKQKTFIHRDDIEKISQSGPATPDHVIRTKRLPMIGHNISEYAKSYQNYFDNCAKNSGDDKKILDCAPRIILDKEYGLISVGANAKAAAIVDDIYDHTIDVISRADSLGGYRALPASDIFDVEYWDLEQAKLKKGGSAPQFSGEVALVTGGASGIGSACVDALLASGAAVASIDIVDSVPPRKDRPDYLEITADVTDDVAIKEALDNIVKRFGGLDMIVLNAGIFTPSTPIESLESSTWRRVFSINVDANMALMRCAKPLLALAPNGGRITIIGSKNVPAPGPGASAYSASKAALTQLGRVAALEWAADGIRVNTLHPDAVFDTGVWTDETLKSRAEAYGMSVKEYKTKNLLKTEIKSSDVATLVVDTLGQNFSKTTGAAIPIDGGNDRVI